MLEYPAITCPSDLKSLTLRVVWHAVKVCLHNKILILQMDRILKEKVWRSGGRKPSAVALHQRR